jgi:PKD repeat protein
VRSAGIATSFSADFTAHSTWGKPPMTVEFKGSVTGTGENVIDWRWDFGDGEVLEGDNPNPKHVYWDEGTYTVSLKATTPSSITTVTKRNLILVSESLPVSQPATLGALIVILILLGKVLVHKHQLEKTK